MYMARAYMPEPFAYNIKRLYIVAQHDLVLIIDGQHVSASLPASLQHFHPPAVAWLSVQLAMVLKGTSHLTMPQQLNTWHL